MSHREDAPRALERRYRWLLSWYPAAYLAANEDELLGVALARSADGQRWPEPGEAVNLIASGIGERLGGMLRQPDHRDTAAVLAVAAPVLLAGAAVRALASPFGERPAHAESAAVAASGAGARYRRGGRLRRPAALGTPSAPPRRLALAAPASPCRAG